MLLLLLLLLLLPFAFAPAPTPDPPPVLAAVDAAVAVAGLLRWPATEEFVPQPSHRLHAGVSALESGGWAYVSEELRGDRDVVLEAVKQIGMASR